MAQFQVHPDGYVFVRAKAGTYSESLDGFAIDFGAAVPPMPTGGICRVYDQGIRHAISDGNSVIAGGDMPWAFGDRAIAGIENILAAQAARVAAAAQAKSKTP